MTTAFRASFVRDVRKIGDRDVLARVWRAIEAVEAANDLRDVPDLKKLSGASGFYRVRPREAGPAHAEDPGACGDSPAVA